MATINESLLGELRSTHYDLLQINNELETLREKWEIAAARYAKIRDLLRVRIGHSPYASVHTGSDWEPSAYEMRLRLVNLPITDGINMILDEADDCLSVQQIVAELQWGGFEFPKDSAPARIVQAAIANRKDLLNREENGVRKFYLPGSWAQNNIEMFELRMEEEKREREAQ